MRRVTQFLRIGLLTLALAAAPVPWMQAEGTLTAIPVQDVTGVKRGDRIFSCDFETDPERNAWTPARYRSFTPDGPDGSMALKVVGDGGSDDVGLRLDLTPYRGMKLYLEAFMKVQDIVQGKDFLPYQGVRYMLSVARSSHPSEYPQLHIGTENLEWTQLGWTYTVPDDAEQITLAVGLRNCTGTAWFDKIAIYCMQSEETLHRPAPEANAVPPDPGHGFLRARGVMSPISYSESDFAALAEWKIGGTGPDKGKKAAPNLIRCQMIFRGPGSIADWADYQAWLKSSLTHFVIPTLAFAKAHGWKVVVDLHNPPGGLNADHSHKMFYDQTVNDHYVETWRQIVTALLGDPNYSAVWAYDLVNEPIEHKPALPGCNVFDSQIRAARAIRAIDPNVTLIAETDDYTSPDGFKVLMPFPPDIAKVVYELHMYAPDYFCMQGITEFGGSHFLLPGHDTYPGMMQKTVGYPPFPCNRDVLAEILKPVREFQQAYNVPIYVGEFSAVRYAKGGGQYLADVLGLFEEYGWDWSYHAYRESQYWDVERPASPVVPPPPRDSETITDRRAALMGGEIDEALPSVGGFVKNWNPDGTPCLRP